MPSSFQIAGPEVDKMASDIILKHHVELDSAAATFNFLMAFRDPEGESYALMKNGQRALGLASVNSLKHRVLGLADGLIQLDGDAWAHMPEKQRMALLDHELTHFEVKRDKKDGSFIYDDINRPLLKLRVHDYEFGGFHEITARYGEDSIEVKNLRAIVSDPAGQYALPFVAAVEEGGK